MIEQKRAWIEINHQALTENISALRTILSPQTKLMTVIKADAYGHGALKVAQTVTAEGADYLAIATLNEGIELRKGGVTAPIMILGAINTVEEIKEIVQWQLEPTLGSMEQVEIFADTLHCLEINLPVHLKIDTGMSRIGVLWHKSAVFFETVAKNPCFSIKSVYSHLACADDLDPTVTNLQQGRFREVIQTIKNQGHNLPMIHLANSAGTLRTKEFHYDMVRIGLALYGLHPAPFLADQIKLTPVMSVKARITQIKILPPNSGVSYSHTFRCIDYTRVAVIGIGYADGVPRLLSNRLPVIVQGRFARQIGNITMDQMMIDITDFPDVTVGEIVTLMGKEGAYSITADDWANTIGTISWEILCGFKNRLPRINY
ncbi:MAG: alanine racemase [Cyanobacterium sp. T60_A2020_053]|nr:alanine racemase [Cyanobacterium sp. T60_A2020_053]